MTVDAVDRIPALFGSAVHKIIEKGERDIPGHIVEERLFVEVLGWKISGAVDLQIDRGDGTWEINDYKVTSVYSVMNAKPEWEQQLNLYAAMMRMNGKRVATLKIIAILRDWQRKQADLSPNYPQSQVVTVDIPVWPDDVQSKFLEDRVAAHQSAKILVDNNQSPPYCSNEERWLRNESWAVMKEGRKSAVKLYDNKEDAEAAVEQLGPMRGLATGHYIEHRPGVPTRCAGNYCLVAQFCKQWQDELGQGAGEGAG